MAGSKRNKIKKLLSTHTPVIDDADEELVNDLLAQLEASHDPVVQKETASIVQTMHLNERAHILESSRKQDPKSRFKARQARKAAALAQVQTPDDPQADARIAADAKQEDEAIRGVCDPLGFEIFQINPDGHCLFSSVADQLALLRIIPPSKASYSAVRAIAADYIQTHGDDFLPFLGSEDTLDTYCRSVRETATWGGEPEIVALSRAFNVPIYVVQGTEPPMIMQFFPNRVANSNDPIVWISYHKRLYGLGEHYNSLRPKRTA